MTVSLSRLTLLPFVFVGSSERATVPPEIVGDSPPLISAWSADSKSVRPARKPGVLMLGMLSAVTGRRWASPGGDPLTLGHPREGAVQRRHGAVLDQHGTRRRSAVQDAAHIKGTSGYAASHARDARAEGPPVRGETLHSVLIPHRHLAVGK